MASGKRSPGPRRRGLRISQPAAPSHAASAVPRDSARNALDEVAQRVNHKLRLVSVRRVPAFGNFQQLGVWNAPLDAADLFQCAVFVFDTLNGQHWALDVFQELFDIPRSEFGCEPD